MNRRSHLLGAASINALALILASAAVAQQSLPTISIGGARAPARPGPAAPGPAPVRVATPAPAPVPVADRYAEPKPAPFSRTLPQNIPAVVESKTREEVFKTTNVVTSADMFRYMPSLHIRERYIGDRNAIVSSRTTGSIQSALSLVYADNVLLSNLLGNSFAFPPRWGMVSPAEVSRIDVMYGPFSALYPGNSIGSVLTMTTRMPDNFEVHAYGTAAVQPYSLYSHSATNLGGVMNVLVGNRYNDLRYWVGYERLDNQGQMQTFPGNVMVPGANNTRFYGGHVDYNHEGFPRVITHAAGADHVQSHMAKFKVSYDLFPNVRTRYQIGYWNLNNDTTVESFIRDRNGAPIYNTQNGRIQFGNFAITPGGVNPGHGAADHLMQALELKSETGGPLDIDFSVTSYNFLRDFTNNAQSYGARPNGNAAGGATAYNLDPRGLRANNADTYWRTGDARLIWRVPYDVLGKHEVSFGGHGDQYSLATVQTSTAVWPSDQPLAVQARNYGKTETWGAYVQDAWHFLPDWKLIAGGRGEWWRAYGGNNFAGGLRVASQFSPGLVTLGPAAASYTDFPQSYKGAFSPKVALEYQMTPEFNIRGSFARAYRFPTVSELFQSLTGPSNVIINNPNLQPEICSCYDLTFDYRWLGAFNGAVGMFNPRVSLFLDDRWNAIVSQNLFNGNTGQFVGTNSNIDRARFYGVELAAVMKDIIIPGLDFSGGLTFTDSHIISNQSAWLNGGGVPNGAAFSQGNLAGTVPPVLYAGNQFPRVPRIRFRGVASYSPNPDMDFSVGMRYSSAAFVSLANTDFNHNNYGSIDSEIISFDAKARYRIAPNWWASIGVNNIGRWKAYVNPNPYPQRTFFVSLNYDLGGPDDVTRGGALASRSAPAADRDNASYGGPAVFR